MYKVSQSKVKTWRRCHKAYHLKYVEELRAKKKSRALHFGSLIHKAIEEHLEGRNPMKVFDPSLIIESGKFTVEIEEELNTLSEAKLIMKEYLIYWQDDPIKYLKINGYRSEHNFEIEIKKGVLWNGKIDAIGTSDNGLRWLIEHKTFSRLPGTDERWRNLQSSTYHKAIDMLGWKPTDGVCWDYIGSKAPPVPGFLKDGTPSLKRMRTLPTALTQFIRSAGLKPKDYEDFIREARSNRSDWFTRQYTPVDNEVKDLVFKEFLDTIDDMVEGHGKKQTMNIERHCAWCEFEKLCRAKLQGLDYDFVKEREYEKAIKPKDDSEKIPHRIQFGD